LFFKFWRLQHIGITNKISLIPCELTDISSIIGTLKLTKPDEICHLAAMSFVGASFENSKYYFRISTVGTMRILEAVRQIVPSARVLHCSYF